MPLTSQIRYVFGADTSVSDGSGKTGLTYSDITAKYLVQGGTLTSLTVETISTLGTWSAPTSSSYLRFKELSNTDPTKGVYEIHFHDTQLATGTRLWLFLSASGTRFAPYEMVLAQDTAWTAILETGFDASRILRIIAAATSGETSGGPGSPVFRNLADTADQLSGSADSSGNRTSMTYGS